MAGTPRRYRIANRFVASKTSSFHLVLIAAVGFSFGVLCRFGDRAPDPYWWFFNVGGPWLALAFAVGIVTPRVWHGAAYGAGTLLSAVAGYYTMMQLIEVGGPDHVDAGSLQAFVSEVVLVWIAATLAGGLIYGAAGSLWRAGSGRARVVTVALPGAALVGESLALITFGWEVELLLATAVLAAILVPWLLLCQMRRRVAALVLTTAFASLVAALWLAFIGTVRLIVG